MSAVVAAVALTGTIVYLIEPDEPDGPHDRAASWYRDLELYCLGGHPIVDHEQHLEAGRVTEPGGGHVRDDDVRSCCGMGAQGCMPGTG